MFALEKFWMIERKRAVAAAKLAPANDNRRVERYAPAMPGRTALVGRWRKNAETGRLEWNWGVEAISDEPEVPLSGGSWGRPDDVRALPNAIDDTSTSPDARALRSTRKIRIALTAQGS